MCNTVPLNKMSDLSVVSALSSFSCSSHVSSLDGEIAFAQLATSPKKHRVRRLPKPRRQRPGKPLPSKRAPRVSLTDDETSSRSQAVVKQLISAISFNTCEGEETEEAVRFNDDDDNLSTVSSLGMGLSDDEQDDLQDDDDDRSCQDSIVRIQSQIKMLRRSSMERFQATPSKSLSLNSQDSHPTPPPKSTDSIPSLPSSCSEREQMWREDGIMPLTRHAPSSSERSRQRFLPFLTTAGKDFMHETLPLSQSLPKDMHYLQRHHSLSAPSRHDTDVESDDEDSCTSFGSDSQVYIRRTDRWGSGGSKSMERDCALVKESFEWASSLRKEPSQLRLSCHSSSCHSSVDSASLHKAAPQRTRSARRDTMLVPPRRRL